MTSSSNIYSPQDPEKSFIWFHGFYHVLLSSRDIHAQSVEGFGGERLRISDIKRNSKCYRPFHFIVLRDNPYCFTLHDILYLFNREFADIILYPVNYKTQQMCAQKFRNFFILKASVILETSGFTTRSILSAPAKAEIASTSSPGGVSMIR